MSKQERGRDQLAKAHEEGERAASYRDKELFSYRKILSDNS